MVRAPRNVVAVGDYTSVSLSWIQDGPVDEWTVYWDPLDGSDVVPFTVTEPRCVVRDLPPGGHEFSIVAWRRGVPSTCDGCVVEATVKELPSGSPAIPVVTEVVVVNDVLVVAWISQNACNWQVRIIDDAGRTCQVLVAVRERRAVFTGIDPSVTYSAQVRAINSHAVSPWSDPMWAQPETQPTSTKGRCVKALPRIETQTDLGVDR